MPAREPMSHVDTAWLRMDQPNNLMQIVGVMLFDGTLDPDRLRNSIEKRLLAYDRFKQLVQQNDTVL
jgi:diacylglycerol O-acyltransferase